MCYNRKTWKRALPVDPKNCTAKLLYNSTSLFSFEKRRNYFNSISPFIEQNISYLCFIRHKSCQRRLADTHFTVVFKPVENSNSENFLKTNIPQCIFILNLYVIEHVLLNKLKEGNEFLHQPVTVSSEIDELHKKTISLETPEADKLKGTQKVTRWILRDLAEEIFSKISLSRSYLVLKL